MKCPNCDKEVPLDSYFCPWCSDYMVATGEGRKAGVFGRFVALLMEPLIGLFLWFVPAGVISMVLPRAGVAFLFLFPLGYFIYWLSLYRQGMTPGKKLMGLRVVKQQTGALPGFGTMFLRDLGRCVSGMFFGAGYFWAIIDKNGQAWHDKIAGTVVVKGYRQAVPRAALPAPGPPALENRPSTRGNVLTLENRQAVADAPARTIPLKSSQPAAAPQPAAVSKGIYLYHNDQTVGPYTREQLSKLLASRAIMSGQQAWCEGLSDWVPLHKLMDEGMDAPATPAPVPLLTNGPSEYAQSPSNKTKLIFASAIGLVVLVLVPVVWSAIGRNSRPQHAQPPAPYAQGTPAPNVEGPRIVTMGGPVNPPVPAQPAPQAQPALLDFFPAKLDSGVVTFDKESQPMLRIFSFQGVDVLQKGDDPSFNGLVVHLTGDDRQRLANFTREQAGRQFVIAYNGNLLMVANIAGETADGTLQFVDPSPQAQASIHSLLAQLSIKTAQPPAPASTPAVAVIPPANNGYPPAHFQKLPVLIVSPDDSLYVEQWSNPGSVAGRTAYQAWIVSRKGDAARLPDVKLSGPAFAGMDMDSETIGFASDFYFSPDGKYLLRTQKIYVGGSGAYLYERANTGFGYEIKVPDLFIRACDFFTQSTGIQWQNNPAITEFSAWAPDGSLVLTLRGYSENRKYGVVGWRCAYSPVTGEFYLPGGVRDTNDHAIQLLNPPAQQPGQTVAQSPSDTAMPGERFPQTRLRILTEGDIMDWNDDTLRYAINEMYARHGADFTDKDIKAWFSKFSWYHPVSGRSYDDAETGFSAIEKQNVDYLGLYRKNRKTAGSPQNAPAQQAVATRSALTGHAYSGSGHVYKVPELKNLVGQKLENSWLYGDFAFMSSNGNVALFSTYANVVLIGFGTTRIQITFTGGFGISDQTVAAAQAYQQQTGAAPTLTMHIGPDNPLKLLRVTKDQDGRLIIIAEYIGQCSL